MHELTIIKSIFNIVNNYALKNNAKSVINIYLEIGALSDFADGWMQKYFNRLSRGTVAEGAKLNITRIPALFKCKKCNGFSRRRENKFNP